MNADDVLRRMRHWIWMAHDDYLKGLARRRPGLEEFKLTSLVFVASKIGTPQETAGAIARLHVVAHECACSTYDVVTPSEAVERIQLALLCAHCGNIHRPAALDAPFVIDGWALCEDAFLERAA